jgi:dipeptidyl aminopeptidase/acylaminoacyl peptidase
MEARIPRTVPRNRARSRPRRPPAALPLRSLAVSGLVGVLAGFAILAFAISRTGSGPSGGAFAPGESVVYARFGTTADTVLRAPAAGSASPRKLFEIAHAREFGIVPALAPDGRAFAYTVLSPDTPDAAADTPAELWLAGLEAGAVPRKLASGFDLMVRPLWTPDGSGVIVRRSGGGDGPYELVRVDVASGAAGTLATSSLALFPVAWGADRSLLYVEVGPAGSDLYRLEAGGAGVRVAHLSDGLTRDWALSPDGGKLAFLAPSQGQQAKSVVEVLDVAAGAVSAVGGATDEFGPAWTADGRLSYGALQGGVRVGTEALAGPARGFDVPLAWSRSGSAVVARTFDGSSVTAPGRQSLTLLAVGGARKTIATGEVTFIGWTYD